MLKGRRRVCTINDSKIVAGRISADAARAPHTAVIRRAALNARSLALIARQLICLHCERIVLTFLATEIGLLICISMETEARDSWVTVERETCKSEEPKLESQLNGKIF